MTTVSIHDAKTHFSKLVDKALAGEEVIVSRGKNPVVKLVPMPEACSKRKLGTAKGMVIKMSDDFDEPLTEFDNYL